MKLHTRPGHRYIDTAPPAAPIFWWVAAAIFFATGLAAGAIYSFSEHL